MLFIWYFKLIFSYMKIILNFCLNFVLRFLMIFEDSFQDYVFKMLNCCYNRNFIKFGKVLVRWVLFRNIVDGENGEIFFDDLLSVV